MSNGNETGAVVFFGILFGVPLFTLALTLLPVMAHLAWYVVAWSWGLV